VLADNHDSPELLKVLPVLPGFTVDCIGQLNGQFQVCAPVIFTNRAKIFAFAEWKLLKEERPKLLVQLFELV